MPRKSKEGSSYPDDWKDIATRVKDAAGWRCARCGAKHVNRAGYTLTVHHLDMDPSNNAWWNTAALCCKCHLQIQHKVVMDRPWVMTEHTDWFRPYAAGYYAHKYLGIEIDLGDYARHPDFFLSLEALAVIGGLGQDALVELWVRIEDHPASIRDGHYLELMP